MDKFYCYCPVCNKTEIKFFKKAVNLSDAKGQLQHHEKEVHNGKMVGTFGKGYSYPEWYNCDYL